MGRSCRRSFWRNRNYLPRSTNISYNFFFILHNIFDVEIQNFKLKIFHQSVSQLKFYELIDITVRVLGEFFLSRYSRNVSRNGNVPPPSTASHPTRDIPNRSCLDREFTKSTNFPVREQSSR